ncbi:MAG: hypothetical protein JWN46_2578 [Acidimicrobiales bacterium]|nr:hypothetical protein [Acidimicrobiales bacterium]
MISCNARVPRLSICARLLAGVAVATVLMGTAYARAAEPRRQALDCRIDYTSHSLNQHYEDISHYPVALDTTFYGPTEVDKGASFTAGLQLSPFTLPGPAPTVDDFTLKVRIAHVSIDRLNFIGAGSFTPGIMSYYVDKRTNDHYAFLVIRLQGVHHMGDQVKPPYLLIRAHGLGASGSDMTFSTTGSDAANPSLQYDATWGQRMSRGDVIEGHSAYTSCASYGGAVTFASVRNGPA